MRGCMHQYCMRNVQEDRSLQECYAPCRPYVSYVYKFLKVYVPFCTVGKERSCFISASEYGHA